MSNSSPERNQAIVLEAFETLFNKHDYVGGTLLVTELHSASAHTPAGRDGLLALIKRLPPTLRYEPGVILAEKDYVIVHGRFSGTRSGLADSQSCSVCMGLDQRR